MIFYAKSKQDISVYIKEYDFWAYIDEGTLLTHDEFRFLMKYGMYTGKLTDYFELTLIKIGV